MFTGIIETVGVIGALVRRPGGLGLVISAKFGSESLALGESVAVSGPCLTVEELRGDGFVVFASEETLSCTTVGEFRVGTRVNLERAMAVGGRFGGHFVAGHVDGVGLVRRIETSGDARIVTFEAPAEVRPFLVPKGSVGIDGVSLTVNDVADGTFSVVMIPHTLSATTLPGLQSGSRVNLEADLIARYVANYVGRTSGSGGITAEKLAGFFGSD